MSISISERRAQFGRTLAAYSTLIRIEGGGVVDLGHDAAPVLADLHVPGRYELRMGFWRGRRVWDVWAVHAFAVWGCDHFDEWTRAYRGMPNQSGPIEDEFADAAWRNDRDEQVRVFDEFADWTPSYRELDLLLRWAVACLKDGERTRSLLANMERDRALDADAWLSIADTRFRLGMPDDEVRDAVERAEAAADRRGDRDGVADAWIAYFGEEGRAAACMRVAGAGPDIFPQLDLVRPELAYIFHHLPRVIDALPEWAEQTRDSMHLESIATAAVFFADDRGLAGEIAEELVDRVDDFFGALSMAQFFAAVFLDFSRANDLLRHWARRAANRESLRRSARDWLEDTGDLVGVRILLDAAKPRRLYARPPSDFLDWVKDVHELLGDAERVAEGMAEAERLALSDDYYQGAQWDAIAQMWIDVGRSDQARRALDAGEPDTGTTTLIGMAKVWHGLGEEDRAERCLKNARTKKVSWDDVRIPEVCNLAVAWVTILGRHDESEQDFAAAEGMATRGRHWTWIANARIELGQTDLARAALRRAEATITEWNDYSRIVNAWHKGLGDQVAARDLLAKAEAVATRSHEWYSLAQSYWYLGDEVSEKRCRRKEWSTKSRPAG